MLPTPDSHSTTEATALIKWLGYLEVDPRNPRLLQQAAEAAYSAGDHTLCAELLARHASVTRLPASLINLQGLLCMSDGNFEAALAHFSLLQTPEIDATLRFNMAYAHAMLQRYEEALACLNDTVYETAPFAVTLGLRLLHHLRRVDEAIDLGRRFAMRGGFDPELPGALASACFDASQPDLAERFAALTPDSPESQTVLGLLALEQGAQTQSAELLASALTHKPDSGRAQLGMGLCLLSERSFEQASAMLDRAATSLQVHAGSWIAAAWAYLFQSDLATARARFERAAEIDRGLAEAPGGLAVVAFHEGHFDEARRLVTTALRLDMNCLAAAFASSLLAKQAGEPVLADSILQKAMETSPAPGGATLGSLIALRVANQS